MNAAKGTLMPMEHVQERILLLRGHKVMIDADLAELYGVPTRALNQAVKRNAERFPEDFMFQLSAAEKREVITNCDHLKQLKFSKSLPFAFTEHGAIQAANVLSSPQAVEMGVYVVRAFVHLREWVSSNKELALRLDELEQRVMRKLRTQDQAIVGLMESIRELMNPPTPKKRPIGFVLHDEGKS